MKIKTITVSGVDDHTDLKGLCTIAKEYPELELGILLSRLKMGEARYPTFSFLEELCNKTDMRLSAHICQLWLLTMIVDGKNTLPLELKQSSKIKVWDRFSRIQLNFYNYLVNANKINMSHEALAENLIKALRDPCFDGKEIIFPHSDKSLDFVQKYMLPEFPKAAILYDNSMGKGQAPSVWAPPYKNHFTSYAGGLNPATLEQTLSDIETVVGDAVIGIDAETQLRTDNLLDLVKIDEYLEKASRYC